MFPKPRKTNHEPPFLAVGFCSDCAAVVTHMFRPGTPPDHIKWFLGEYPPLCIEHAAKKNKFAYWLYATDDCSEWDEARREFDKVDWLFDGFIGEVRNNG